MPPTTGAAQLVAVAWARVLQEWSQISNWYVLEGSSKGVLHRSFMYYAVFRLFHLLWHQWCQSEHQMEPEQTPHFVGAQVRCILLI